MLREMHLSYTNVNAILIAKVLKLKVVLKTNKNKVKFKVEHINTIKYMRSISLFIGQLV